VNPMSKVVKAKTKLKRLLKEYKDIFREELPDGLPPKRAVDHAIDTGDHSSVNKNAYPLSVQQLQEQVRQIEDLLKRGLIRESISPSRIVCAQEDRRMENVHRLQDAELQDCQEYLSTPQNTRMY